MPTVDVDLSDPRLFRAGVPYAAFARWRQDDPVAWLPERDGPGFWSVTRYQDVLTVNRDNQAYSSARKATLFFDQPEEYLAQQRLMMLNMDPPMHTRYRLLVNKGFTPRMVAQLEDDIRRSAREIIDAVTQQGHCDFVTAVAAELPLQVIATLLGVPHEDRHLVFDWSNSMVGMADPEYRSHPEIALGASLELYAYASRLVEAKRRQPGHDLISVLLDAEVDGERLSQTELDMFFLLLSVAGNETTRNLISHGMLALIEHPDERARLRADPGLLPTAVEEMLRWATPVMHFRRTASRDLELGDRTIHQDDKVVIWYSSANRDETVFTDPDRFDVGRDPNPHIAFGGGGPHFCLGANLARLEIRILFEELLDRLPDMELTGPPERLTSNFINGIKHLPVTW